MAPSFLSPLILELCAAPYQHGRDRRNQDLIAHILGTGAPMQPVQRRHRNEPEAWLIFKPVCLTSIVLARASPTSIGIQPRINRPHSTWQIFEPLCLTSTVLARASPTSIEIQPIINSTVLARASPTSIGIQPIINRFLMIELFGRTGNKQRDGLFKTFSTHVIIANGLVMQRKQHSLSAAHRHVFSDCGLGYCHLGQYQLSLPPHTRRDKKSKASAKYSITKSSYTAAKGESEEPSLRSQKEDGEDESKASKIR
ncbi:hypothetical protein B0H13DRAFT_1907385 [Mycena leptocephala]|nr:hypothetical protein B0H13DRAFT_1907385 [Mycena leptocephala]